MQVSTVFFGFLALSIIRLDTISLIQQHGKPVPFFHRKTLENSVQAYKMSRLAVVIGLAVGAIGALASFAWLTYKRRRMMYCRHADEKHPIYFVNEDGDVVREECTICLTEMELSQSLIKLPCLHIFHSGCVELWGRCEASCPLCRQRFDPFSLTTRC